MNKLDTALITASLSEAGYDFVDEFNQADVVLMNTCSVRKHAEDKVFSNLGIIKSLKENKQSVILGIIGCMAQRLGGELLENKTVDFVCGPSQIPQIVDLINKAIHGDRSTAVLQDIRTGTSDNESARLEDFESVFDRHDKNIPGQAFVRAMRGCNNFCSYCIVPYVRGPEISRSPQFVVEQVKKLADEGVKMVTLLGQTVNSYNYKSGDKTYSLADLLDMVSDIAGIEWIRFVTNYPQEKYYDDILEVMAGNSKICNYLHMCAQSGSNRILKAMNRRYTAEQYLDLVARAKEGVKGIAVAGDFIIGFPGETEEDFQQTVELVKQARYRNAFIFKYSPRPGTKSEIKMIDDVPAEVKKRRNIELLAVQEQISSELSKEFEGRTVRVLVEGLSKKPHLNKAENLNMPQLVGRTTEDWIVVFNGHPELAGNFARVKITKSSPLTLFGHLVE